MKGAMQMLILWLSVNLMAGALYALGVSPGIGQVDSHNPEQVYDAFNPNQTITGWTADNPEFTVGDPVRALRKLWTTIGLAVATVPTILGSWGVPDPIVNVLNALWIIIWAVFTWEFISGRLIAD